MKGNLVYPKCYLIGCSATALILLIALAIPLPESLNPEGVYRLLTGAALYALLFTFGLAGLFFCRRGYPFLNITIVLLLSPVAALLTWTAENQWQYSISLILSNLVFGAMVIYTWKRTIS